MCKLFSYRPFLRLHSWTCLASRYIGCHLKCNSCKEKAGSFLLMSRSASNSGLAVACGYHKITLCVPGL